MIPRNRLRSNPLEGDSVTVAGNVAVGGEGVREGCREGVAVTGAGVNVAVAGGVTRRSSFWSGWMIEVLSNPFQDISSESEIP